LVRQTGTFFKRVLEFWETVKEERKCLRGGDFKDFCLVQVTYLGEPSGAFGGERGLGGVRTKGDGSCPHREGDLWNERRNNLQGQKKGHLGPSKKKTGTEQGGGGKEKKGVSGNGELLATKNRSHPGHPYKGRKEKLIYDEKKKKKTLSALKRRGGKNSSV